MSNPTDIFERLPRLLKAGKKVALCTVVEKIGSGPAERGTKALVTEDGDIIGTVGGGEFERKVREEAFKAIKKGKSKSLKFALYGEAKKDEVDTGLWCGGTTTVFVDVIEPDPKLVIVGSGHVALPTYRVAELLGFDITVVDDERSTLTKDRFPKAKRIYRADFQKALKEVKVDEHTFVAIVHGEPKHDLAALRRFVRERTAYLGLLGSARKISKLKEILRKEGVPEKAIKRIHAPIGLDIGAVAPEEIAVSIAAELIKERKKS
ncbi:MAG: XdhC/CoxI family protein [Hadesarchaea archaeon]|nr:XdhC/CoxI family protein [Hadesarchaea archaeon]